MTNVNAESMLWVAKYAPKTIKDCILPASLKTVFQGYVDKGEIPNMILAGSQGLGKTTVAKALCAELNIDHILINGSTDRGIDETRTTIRDYGSTLSLTGGRKVIIIDEADNLTHAAQLALRGVIEELQDNCSFILTCNYKNRLIPAIQSRMPATEFIIPKEEKPSLAGKLLIRLCGMLEVEKIPYEKSALVALIKRSFPDMRLIIGECQKYSMTGKIDAGILVEVTDNHVDQIYGFMKQKNFKELRKAVTDVDNHDMAYDQLYGKLVQYIAPQSVPAAIVILGKYAYQNAFAASKEINLMACCSEIFLECNFND